MVIAADYPFLDIFWTMLVFFAWVIWFVILFRVLMDIFRRHDIGGWGKTGWIIFVIILPFLGVFIYLIASGKGMAERDVAQSQAAKSQFDDYVRSVSSESGPASEIAKAKALLADGTITQEEFDALKAKALA
jgi:hypothetical protein